MNRLSSPSLRTAAAILLLVLIALPFWARNANSQAPEQEADAIAQEEEITAPASSTVPIFSYQGQLLDNDGNPITADLPMTFRLYDVATDGAPCWTEEHTSDNAVNVTNGLFHVLLGQIDAIDTACLSTDTYLELEINGEPLTPRELLTDVAKAVEAGTLVDGATTQGSLTMSGDLDLGTHSINNVDQINAVDTGLEITNSTHAIKLLSHSAITLFIDTTDSPTQRAFHIFANGDSSATATKLFQIKDDGETYINGNVGIGTTTPDTKLSVIGVVRGAYDEAESQYVEIRHGATNGYINSVGDGRLDFRHEGDTKMSLTEAGKLGIGTTSPAKKLHVAGAAQIDGNLILGGSCSMASTLDGESVASLEADAQCSAGSITGGAYIEGNLQTVAERRAGGNQQFSEGDLLCWGEGKLELCDTPNDSLVQGVADAKGNPIVLGAEPIKVIGNVKKGDYLVASSVPGYAMASKNPTFGIVIAQALEDFEGEKGLIKAMIRKM